jgi:hypothetical protein
MGRRLEYDGRDNNETMGSSRWEVTASRLCRQSKDAVEEEVYESTKWRNKESTPPLSDLEPLWLLFSHHAKVGAAVLASVRFGSHFTFAKLASAPPTLRRDAARLH